METSQDSTELLPPPVYLEEAWYWLKRAKEHCERGYLDVADRVLDIALNAFVRCLVSHQANGQESFEVLQEFAREWLCAVQQVEDARTARRIKLARRQRRRTKPKTDTSRPQLMPS